MTAPLSPTRAAVALAAAALALAGCRHAQKTAAAPVTAPPAVVKASPPETKVASPSNEFSAPAATADVSSTSAKAIEDAFFDFNSAAIRPDAASNLQSTAQWLRAHHNAQVEVEGHCDERGTEQYNLALGERRAWNAKEYLSTLGVDPKRVSTISYGKDKPFAEGHDEAAWSQNRRAHIVLTAAAR